MTSSLNDVSVFSPPHLPQKPRKLTEEELGKYYKMWIEKYKPNFSITDEHALRYLKWRETVYEEYQEKYGHKPIGAFGFPAEWTFVPTTVGMVITVSFKARNGEYWELNLEDGW